MSRRFASPIAWTSPWLTSTSTGDSLAWAARATATSVSWLSTLNAPTAKCSSRLRAISSRALRTFSVMVVRW